MEDPRGTLLLGDMAFVHDAHEDIRGNHYKTKLNMTSAVL